MAQEKNTSKAQGFTHGMVSDSDPRFQIKGSYSDALNIRLTNESGDTFTVENIEGNQIWIDLYAVNHQHLLTAWNNGTSGMLGTRHDIPLMSSAPSSSNYFSEIYWDENNTDSSGNLVGPLHPSPTNPGVGAAGLKVFFDRNGDSLENRASIVGYTTHGNEMILIIVASFRFSNVAGSQQVDLADRTIFLRIRYDNNMNIESVHDLGVCYSYLDDNYPDLNMNVDMPVRVESMIENECITRIYWTDNENPLRTLNVNQEGKNQLPPDTLNLTPLMTPSQPVLGSTIAGNLPVGVYQYCYKYISANGGETTFSPLSNLYFTSNQGIGSSTEFSGGPKGELGTMGHKMWVYDLDSKFQYIELYALLYEDLNLPPKVALVDRRRIVNNTEISFSHITWNNEILDGLEEVLIETNTWEVCKDIAIKDNILFAANLKQKKNYISEKEWNVKVLRYRINDASPGSLASSYEGILTTNDPDINHYDSSGLASSPCTGHLYSGQEHTPAWATIIDEQRNTSGLDLSGRIKNTQEYRFLKDGITLGGESWRYSNNEIGGCRVSFGVRDRVADDTTNNGQKPYISATNNGLEQFQTDNIYTDDGTIISTDGTNTVFQTSTSLGGTKDPHVAGDKRGYQRGEIYRFGVQIYDLAGAPGNVLWIGDIQMPEMHDVLRMIYPDRTDPVGNVGGPSVYHPMLDSQEMMDKFIWGSHKYAQDHRLSYIYGHTVPPVDVNWFTGRTVNTTTRRDAYVYDYGWETGGSDINPVDGIAGKNAKWYPWFNDDGIPPVDGKPSLHDDKHYLFDLYVNFEFIIPENVRKKISGFRVVRAERLESDRRIMQQGILNQTMKYGRVTHDLEGGYDNSVNFSNQDNENLDDNPVFINDDQTNFPEQPEYDTYLNGFIGLAENNHLAAFDDMVTNGKLTEAPGYTEGWVYAFGESELRLDHYTSYSYRTETPPGRAGFGSFPSMGSKGRKHMHSALFGSYEKCQSGQQADPSTPTTYTGVPKLNRYAMIPNNIFTLDSPDSAFGIRPYNFREGDMLRIDTVLKLSDQKRYLNDTIISNNAARRFFDNASGETGTTGSLEWTPGGGTGQEESASLRFASKKTIDRENDYGMLLGKYYCYDTYWGIGMETDGGQTYADQWENAATPVHTAVPGDYRYFKDIAIAKELGDGEILSSSFFKEEDNMLDGSYHGFSNNTLGFISDSNAWQATWGGVSGEITVAGSGGSGSNLSTKEDLTYNTMSTIQMGLRTILLETENNTYNFHPRHLSHILDNQSWQSRNSQSSGASLQTNQQEYWLGNARSASTTKSYIPFKYLCSIVRKSVPYGGYTKSVIESTRYIPCGNIHRVSNAGTGRHGHLSQVFGGDTFVNLYSHQKTACPYMLNSYARFQVFPVESYVNTDMRSGLHLNANDTEVGKDPVTPPFSNDWLYNNVYSQENTLKSGIMINEEQACDALDLPFEIAYSNTKIAGEPGDSFRVFPMNNFHDMEGQFGEINRIFNFKNEIYTLQDEAFAKLLVNPISMISDDAGTSLFTGTGDTVENHIYVSTKFGTRHMHSVATSEQAIYFVDSRYARLFKYDTEKLISLGDSLGQRSALNILIKEINDLDSFKKIGRNYIADNTLKFLGIQSIFDHKNKELIVTFHNSNIDNQKSPVSEAASTLVFNEGVNAFSSYYSATPNYWILADPAIISTSNERSVTDWQLSPTPTGLREGALKLWRWNHRDDNLKCLFFLEDQDPGGFVSQSSIEKIINENAESSKVFDNAQIVMTPNIQTAPQINAFTTYLTENNFIESKNITSTANARYREGILRFPLRLNSTSQGRMRGTWLKVKYTAYTTEKFNIFAILAKYRKSYN